jgi:hypothetical protein
MRKIAVVLLVPWALFAQELVGEFSLDTNIYTSTGLSCGGIIGPEAYNSGGGLQPYRIKGTNQIDIFTVFYQKIGTITIPDPPPIGKRIDLIYCSQKFLDEDIGWEFIVNYYDTVNDSESFKVIDETGTVLLSDENSAQYGFDGQNTYVFAFKKFAENLYRSFKVWKFRSNISSTSQPLSKTTSSPGPLMTYLPSGDFRVSLQPVTGGTSIQFFDMLGRQIFQKSIQNMREPTSFIIPSYSMPNSPFVAKVNNSNGSFVKKAIPAQ